MSDLPCFICFGTGIILDTLPDGSAGPDNGKPCQNGCEPLPQLIREHPEPGEEIEGDVE